MLKGIIMAGGRGTRLFPITKISNKQLIPIYDKPMIYYPLSTLMEAGIQDILIISDEDNLPSFKKLLGDGAQFGIRISYAEQEKPQGIAQAFLIAEEWLKEDVEGNTYVKPVTLILGDNLFYGLGEQLVSCMWQKQFAPNDKATVFLYRVKDPERYGVAEVDNLGNVSNIVEKPKKPKTNLSVTGIYIYPNDVVEKTKSLELSPRGELEITDLNNRYISDGRLEGLRLKRGAACLDTGTPSSMLEASNFVCAIQNRTGMKVGCIEEIAWRYDWISDSQMKKFIKDLDKTEYGMYLKGLRKDDV